MSFHEMLNTQDKRVLSKVQDFKVNLIAPADIADNDFGKFKSTLKEVLKYIKYSQNDDKVQEFVNNSEVLEKLGNKEIRVLNACADANLEEMEEKEEFNPDEMCEAIKTIADRAAKEAAKKVTEEAEEQLRLDTLFKNINKMMSKMEYTKEQAMDLLDVSESDQKMLLERFK
jgi:bifunctional DNA-binding transcriptional regulator/antitoxin component of YhaV-PrlF toxin-antitoxin module